jgi:hypothetical protein
MTCKVNADTTNGLKLESDTSGIVEIQNNGTTIITSQQPSFSAVMTNTSHQTVSASTFTKVVFNVEDWDTDSKYDSVTNYRFTPTVAGIYQFNIAIRTDSSTTNGITLYKNGSLVRRSFVSGTIYVKLSTMEVADTDDYFEAFGFTTGTSFRAEAYQQWFQAHYIRSV